MRIVQCHGCFDVLHVGHIRHFEAAKKAGDYLVVTVTPDEYVNKGAGRPVFPLAQRMEAIRALRCVDEVRSSGAANAVPSILEIKPAVFAKGPDYSTITMDSLEVAAVKHVDGDFLFTQTEKFSSTALLQPREKHSPEVDAYLSALKKKYSAADVLGWLEKARALKVLVVGEHILDEYRYCNVLGKAGKEPILAAQELRSERFVGGALAVAEHARCSSDDVDCIQGPPIIKRRFIESYPFQKLFETYEMNEAEQADAIHYIELRRDYDLLIVADYGHGFMNQTLRALAEKARFLAVNVQANAGNHGFNTISKYPHADFISLSERELRLNARDQATDVQVLMEYEGSSRRAAVLVTRGEHGCIGYHDGQFSKAPALITHTVDRIGAGDAVFAVTACCAAIGMPLDMLTFIAAVVGTMAVGIVGNARYIERAALQQAIQEYLA